MTTTTITRRELAHRASNGIDVSLFWDKVGDTLTLEIYDSKSDEFFEVEVPRDRALDAFHHPFAYVPDYSAAAEPETLAA
jgi:hypothetical protein